MVKLRLGNEVVLILEAENLKRLKQGQPIKVCGKDLGLDVDIYIDYGDTQADIKKKFNLPDVH